MFGIISAVASIASSFLIAKEQRKAQERAQQQAKRDAIEADMQARKAEVFAETEGAGIGNIGQVSLEVDDDLDEDEEVQSNVRI